MKKFWGALPLIAILATSSPALANFSNKARQGGTEKRGLSVNAPVIKENWIGFPGIYDEGVTGEQRIGIVVDPDSHTVVFNDYVDYEVTTNLRTIEGQRKRGQRTTLKIVGFEGNVVAMLITDKIENDTYRVVTEAGELDGTRNGEETIREWEYNSKTDTLKNPKASDKKIDDFSKIVAVYKNVKALCTQAATAPGLEGEPSLIEQANKMTRRDKGNGYFNHLRSEIKKTLGKPKANGMTP